MDAHDAPAILHHGNFLYTVFGLDFSNHIGNRGLAGIDFGYFAFYAYRYHNAVLYQRGLLYSS